MPKYNIQSAFDYVAEEWKELYIREECGYNSNASELQRARAMSALNVLEYLTGKELYYNSTDNAIKEV